MVIFKNAFTYKGYLKFFVELLIYNIIFFIILSFMFKVFSMNNLFEIFILSILFNILLLYEGIYSKKLFLYEYIKQVLKVCFVFFLLSAIVGRVIYNQSTLFMLLNTVLIFTGLIFSKYLSNLILRLLKLNDKAYYFLDAEATKFFRENILKSRFLNLTPCDDDSEADIIFISTSINELQSIIYNYTKKGKIVFLIDSNGLFLPFSYTSHIKISTNIPILEFRNNLTEANKILKRIFDILFSVFVLIVTLPLIFIISLAILITSGRPIFYTQVRLGENGKLFKIYKFRTMHNNSHKILKELLEKDPNLKLEYETYRKLKNDPRITKIGKILRKLSIDEIPQFFNVLKGDMSVVGPRPYMRSEYYKMKEYKDYILSVKPGITGLWQVSGRNKITFQKRLEIDKWYVINWSFYLDIVIIFKTIFILLKRDGY